MWFLRFCLHAALTTLVAGVGLYLPGKHELGVAVIGLFWFQILAALLNAVWVEPRERLAAAIVGLAAAAWGCCCCLVAAMSLNNSWL